MRMDSNEKELVHVYPYGNAEIKRTNLRGAKGRMWKSVIGFCCVQAPINVQDPNRFYGCKTRREWWYLAVSENVKVVFYKTQNEACVVARAENDERYRVERAEDAVRRAHILANPVAVV